MVEEDRQVEFIDNGTAPEFFANGLHDVEMMGPNSRLILFVLRRTPGGVLFREPAFTYITPTDAIGPAIALKLRKLGAAIIIPNIGTVTRQAMLH